MKLLLKMLVWIVTKSSVLKMIAIRGTRHYVNIQNLVETLPLCP